MRARVLVAAAAAMLAAAAFAADDDDADARTAPPDYTFTCDVDAPVKEVWDLFTTPEGMTRWAVAQCEADFRPGGTMRTHYSPSGEIGDPNTIVHHIDAVAPYRMYAAHVTPPADAGPFAIMEQTRGVVWFEELAPDRTRVTWESYGWGEGPEWDEFRKLFDAGNAWTVARLRKLYAPRDRRAEARETLDALTALAGDWVGEAKVGDAPARRIHLRYEKGPGARAVSARARAVEDAAPWLHSTAQIWLAPGDEAVRFHDIDENGTLWRGAIDRDGDALVWHCEATSTDGATSRCRVRQDLEDGAFVMRLRTQDDDGAWTDRVAVRYERVEEVPEDLR